MKKVMVIALPLLLLPGCAMFVVDKGIPISVVAAYGAEEISGATCQVVNDAGATLVTTPSVAYVKKSISDLRVSCKKGDLKGTAVVSAQANGSAVVGGTLGNILLWGPLFPIGVGVDAASGSMSEYPMSVTVEMR